MAEYFKLIRHSKQVQRSCMLIWNPVKHVCEALLNFYKELINQRIVTMDSKSTRSFAALVWNDANSGSYTHG